MNTSVEFKVQVGSELVAHYGKDRIEQIIQENLNLAVVKLAKEELLEDLKSIDVQGCEWVRAREKAWTDYGDMFLFKVSQ